MATKEVQEGHREAHIGRTAEEKEVAAHRVPDFQEEDRRMDHQLQPPTNTKGVTGRRWPI